MENNEKNGFIKMRFQRNVDQTYYLVPSDNDQNNVINQGDHEINNAVSLDVEDSKNGAADSDVTDFNSQHLLREHHKEINSKLNIRNAKFSSLSYKPSLSQLHFSTTRKYIHNGKKEGDGNHRHCLDIMNPEIVAFSKSKDASNIETEHDYISCEQCGEQYANQELLTCHILQQHDSIPF